MNYQICIILYLGPFINQEEEEVSDSDEKDIFQFNDTDGNTDLFDNGIKKENQNIISS